MTREEVTIAMGLDSTSLQRGLGLSAGYVKQWTKAVQTEEEKYSAWWNQELKRREEMEVAASVRAASRAIKARRLLREREEARTVVEQSVQNKANDVISAGSVPAGWAEQAAAKKAAIELEKKAAEGLKEVGESAHFGAGATREVMVLFREGLRGNIRAMIGSFTRLIGLLNLTGGQIAAMGAGAAAAAATIYYYISMRKAEDQWEASEERNTRAANEMAKRLRTDVQGMLKTGRIGEDLGKQMMMALENPTIEGIAKVAATLRPYGTSKNPTEIARLQAEHLKKLVEYNRENETIEQRRLNDQLRVTGLKHDLAQLDRFSLEYAQKQLELDEALHDLQADDKKIAEGKLELQQRLNDEQKIYNEAKLRLAEINQRDREKYMPTLQEFARHGGEAGRTARMIERDERRIKQDYFRGDTAAAGRDIADRNRLYDTLSSRGLTAERTELREMRELNKKMQMSLENIEKGTARLSARIMMG